MSLVSNFIGGIGVNSLSSLSNPLKNDVNNNDFEALLQKQMEGTGVNEGENTTRLLNLGAPPGFEIENFDGIDFSETAQDQIEAVGEKIDTQENMSNPFDMNGDGNVTTSEAVTFFTSLLDNSSNGENARSELFDFAKKQASNLYNKYSRTVVTDVKEFVNDIQGMIS